MALYVDLDKYIADNFIYLPVELKVEYADALIIYHDDDKDAAQQLQKAIEQICVVDGNGTTEAVMAKAVLYEEAASHVNSEVEWLNWALELHTYIFAIYTENFMAEPKLAAMSSASFWDSVTGSEDKRNCFCPVYLKRARSQLLSAYIKSLRGLDIFREGWEKKVESVIKLRYERRLEREQQLKADRVQYLERYFGRLDSFDAGETDTGYQSRSSSTMTLSTTYQSYTESAASGNSSSCRESSTIVPSNIADTNESVRVQPCSFRSGYEWLSWTNAAIGIIGIAVTPVLFVYLKRRF